MERWSAGSACSLGNRGRRIRLRHRPDIGREFRYNIISEHQRDGFELMVMGKASDRQQAHLCFSRLPGLARHLLCRMVDMISSEEFSIDILDDESVAGEAGITMARLGAANFGVWRA
jgi:hypothetical protein